MITYYKVDPLEFAEIVTMTDPKNIHAKFINLTNGNYNNNKVRIYLFMHEQRCRYRMFFENKNERRVNHNNRVKGTFSVCGVLRAPAYNYLLQFAQEL